MNWGFISNESNTALWTDEVWTKWPKVLFWLHSCFFLTSISFNKREGKRGNNESFPVPGQLLILWCWEEKDLTQNHRTVWLSPQLVSNETIGRAVFHRAWFISTSDRSLSFRSSPQTHSDPSALWMLCSPSLSQSRRILAPQVHSQRRSHWALKNLMWSLSHVASGLLLSPGGPGWHHPPSRLSSQDIWRAVSEQFHLGGQNRSLEEQVQYLG